MALSAQKPEDHQDTSQTTTGENERHHSPRHEISVYVIALIASLGGVMLGYDTGTIGGTELLLRKDFALNPTLEELVVSAVLIGGIIGASIAGKVSNTLGRKKTALMIAVIFLIGGLLTTFSWNIWMFIAFRIVMGISLGLATLVTPVYISEIAPADKRGTLVTFNQLALSAAIPVAYCVNLGFDHVHAGWRPMFGVECLLALGLGIGMFFMPESPRWLASKGKWQKAEKALERIQGRDEKTEIQKIKQALASTHHSSIKDFFTTGLGMALLVGVGVAAFQQLVGINAISLYAPTIFKDAGFHSQLGDMLATSLVGVMSVIAKGLASFLLDRTGRRPLLLISLAGLTITLTGIGISFAFSTHAGYFILVCLLIYIFAYSIGIGPIFSLLISEIFPTRLRSAGGSISMLVNWAFTLLISVTFLSLLHLLNKSWTFWLYALFAIMGFLFCWFLVPETKGKSMEQIEHYWEDGRHFN